MKRAVAVQRTVLIDPIDECLMFVRCSISLSLPDLFGAWTARHPVMEGCVTGMILIRYFLRLAFSQHHAPNFKDAFLRQRFIVSLDTVGHDLLNLIRQPLISVATAVPARYEPDATYPVILLGLPIIGYVSPDCPFTFYPVRVFLTVQIGPDEVQASFNFRASVWPRAVDHFQRPGARIGISREA